MQLLDSLGDPEKQAAAQQQQQQPSRDWRAAASSWLASSPLARSALGSLTAAAPSTIQPAAVSARPEGPALPTEDEQAYAQLMQKATAAAAAAAAAVAAAGQASTGPSSSSELSPACSLNPSSNQPTAAAARSPRAPSSTAPAAPAAASAGSFSFHPKQQDSSSAHAAAKPASTAADGPGHQRGKSDSDSSHKGGWSGLKSYYGYIVSPAQGDELAALQEADVQKVQEAAGAALAEANKRLLQAELRVQVAQVGGRVTSWTYSYFV